MLPTILLFWGITLSASQHVTAQEQLDEASLLLAQHREQEALNLYLEILRRQPDTFEAVTAASYLYGQLGNEIRSKRREYYSQALALARRAMQLQPDDPETHLVLAWSMGAVAQISGARQRVRLARQLKTHVDRSIEQRPQDHRAWYILANWHYEVAKANFWERAAAKVLFGGLPSEASLENAISAFERAVELKPDSIPYRCELARILGDEKRKEDAVRQLEAGLELAAATPYQLSIQNQCRTMLNSLRR